MDDRQKVLDEAVAAGDVPHVVAMVANAEGVTWQGASGEAVKGREAAPDTVFRIFSMTKAIGSLAAMILIDRGDLSMETPVADILPGFGDTGVLDGWEGDTPRFRSPETPVTVRHLATHTSGLVYEFWNKDMAGYLERTGRPTVLAGTKDSLNYPLMFDPGARWDYGIGIDWLGQVVEAVDGRRIDAFCQAEIFDPLDMPDTAMEPRPDMTARLAAAKARGADGAFADIDLAPPPEPEVYGMGHCLYSTPQDYMRFLRTVLGGGALEGARLLSEDGHAAFCANQIGALRVGTLLTAAPPVSADVNLFPGIDKTHAFGFLRVEEDVPGMRAAGSLGWAGVLNTHYWIDPTRDVAAVIMTQTLPFVEPRFLKTYEAFERAVYAA